MTRPIASWLPAMLAAATDLVMPGGCAGCDGAAGQPLHRGVCDRCVAAVGRLRPGPTRPDPAPAGLPPCAALGDYGGVLRSLILAYKDHGRHPLGRPLGRLLATVVASLASGPVLLVPVPDTPAAARSRFGDHLWRMARPAAARLRAAGQPVALARPLRARPRPDSAGLDMNQRAAQAAGAFQVRPMRLARARRRVARSGAQVILLDDVVTTGATLAAAAARLTAAGLPVTGAAVLAATRRTHPAAAVRTVAGKSWAEGVTRLDATG